MDGAGLGARLLCGMPRGRPHPQQAPEAGKGTVIPAPGCLRDATITRCPRGCPHLQHPRGKALLPSQPQALSWPPRNSAKGEAAACSVALIHGGKTETLPNCTSPKPEPSAPAGAPRGSLQPFGDAPIGVEEQRAQRAAPIHLPTCPQAEPIPTRMILANRFCCSATRTASRAQPDPLLGAFRGETTRGETP